MHVMFTKTKQEKLQYCMIAVWKNIGIMMKAMMHELQTRREFMFLLGSPCDGVVGAKCLVGVFWVGEVVGLYSLGPP